VKPRRARAGAPPAGGGTTLERFVSKAGAGSRSEARRWIAAGRVRVDGRVVRDILHWVEGGGDGGRQGRARVSLDGREIHPARRVHLLLHKPAGYVTTRRDPEGRPTVYDLLPPGTGYVFTAGRLDLDTSGLLIVTNDSRLADRISDPRFKVPKTYVVKASRRLSGEELARLRQGVTLRDGPTRPAAVRHVRDPGGKTVFEITITEGRNRQVRRMVEALGAKVIRLERVAIGPLRLGDLPEGRTRELEPEELRALISPR